MFARICQQTGENWEEVRLSVSNAVPLRGSTLPDLHTWYLELPSWRTPPVAAGIALSEDLADGLPPAGGKGKAQTARSGLDLAVAAALPEAEFSQAESKALPLAFEYQFGQAVNLGSDGSDTMLPLFTRKMKANFFVYAVPAQEPLAYLACRAEADAELLAGRLNVYVGGRFAGGTGLEEKKAGEALLLNLGVARTVKVRREKIVDRRSETFFGMVDRQSIARELVYETVVENLKNKKQRVHLLDSIPVSKTDRIQIKGVEISPDPSEKEYRGRKGVMLWDIEIPPESVYKIRVKFFVKHPKDRVPQGL
jgi:uncharacterized protein (TIGR02231 family)